MSPSSQTSTPHRQRVRFHLMALASVLSLVAACEGGAPKKPTATAQQPLAKSEGCGSGPATPPGASTEIYKVPVGAHVRGAADAKVTLVAFCEFQCPYCKRAAPVLAALQKEYGSSLRVVFKHLPLPFHDRALPAALAVEAAGEQGRFFEMHDRLFASSEPLTDERIETEARELGLELGAFRTARTEDRLRQRIVDDQKLAEQLGVRGTPSFFVNGRKLVGLRPLEAFKALIDEELEKASALLARGTAPSALYDTLTRDGLTRSAPAATEAGERGASPESDQTVHKIELGKSPSRGPAAAPITIAVFSDFQCPFCKRIEPTLQALEKEFPGQLRVVWKNFPLAAHGSAARDAARAALAAAEQGQFWAMHDKLFENQPALDRQSLERYAAELGLQLPAFRTALDSADTEAAIAADLKQGEALGVHGTPALFVNGRRIEGAQPLPIFRTIVKQELAKRSRGD